MKHTTSRLTIVLALLGALGITAAHAAQTRCGWIENDMPSELALKDRDGRWEIANIAYTAKGFQNMPPTNKGDSCGCLSVEVDPQSKQVTKVLGGKLKPVSACQQDKHLK